MDIPHTTRHELYRYRRLIHPLSLSHPSMILPIVLAMPITDKGKAASLPDMPQDNARSTVKTYGTLNPMLVRKLLAAYIMNTGSLNREKSSIWFKIFDCLGLGLKQQMEF